MLRWDHRKYTVGAVLLVVMLLLLAGTVIAESGLKPVITNFQPDQTAVEAGQEVIWTAEAGGGAPPFQYAFYIFKRVEGGTDPRVYMQWYSTVNSVKYTPREEGVYYARAFVQDKDGETVWGDTLPVHDVHVSGGVAALSGVNFTEQPEEDGTVDTPLTYKVQAIGGEGEIEYAFYVYKDDVRVHLVWYGEVSPVGEIATLTYTPKEGGVYQVQAFAKDATGKALSAKSNKITVTGSSAALQIAIEDKPVVDGFITWTVTASGGEPPYEYAFYVYKGETRVAMEWYKPYTEPVTFTYAPKEPGVYQLQAFVKDDEGKTAYIRGGDAEFTQATAALSVAVALEGDGPTWNVGDAQTWKAAAAGGEPPYEYAFYVYEGEARVLLQWYGGADSVSYTPKQAETDYYVRAFVRDQLGATALQDSARVQFTGETIAPFHIASVGFKEECTAEVQHLAEKATVQGQPNLKDGLDEVQYPGYSLSEFGVPWVWEVKLPALHDGVGPFSYSYYVYRGETRVAMYWYGEKDATCDYTPAEVGEYWVRAFVQDANGRVVRAESARQETKLYHFYYTFKPAVEGRADQFQAPNDQKTGGFGYVVSSGYLPLAEHHIVTIDEKEFPMVTSDPLGHRSYNNHTASLTVAVSFEEGYYNYVNKVKTFTGDQRTIKFSGDLPAHLLRGLGLEDKDVFISFAGGQIPSQTADQGNVNFVPGEDDDWVRLATGVWYKIVDLKKDEISGKYVSFQLETLDGTAVKYQSRLDNNAGKFYYIENGQTLVDYNAPGDGVLYLGTKADFDEDERVTGPYTWTCDHDGAVYRFAGLRPGLAGRNSSVRREFFQYMITPNLPYGEVKFRNIRSVGGDEAVEQEARFNFDLLLNTSVGLNDYDERVGISISASGRIGILDTKAGQGYRDLERNFYTAPLAKNATEYGFVNDAATWNTLRLQCRADGKVDMILNGHVVYTTPFGYYHITNAERGTIMLEVVQAAEEHEYEGWNSEQVGDAFVELTEYSFGILKLAQIAPDPGMFSYTGQ